MALEDTMAQLAHSQVSQSMPSLANDIQGFQLIESNDENNSAIGVVVALIGNLVVYIPAIFRKGRIYSLDIMYIPELRQWLPTQDNWITYLRARRADLEASITPSNGAAGTKSGAVNLEEPLIRIIKAASESYDIKYIQRSGIPAVLSDAAAIIDSKRTGDVENIVSQMSIPSAKELLTKCASTQAAQRMVVTMSKHPDVLDAFVQHYSDKDLEDIATAVITALGKVERTADNNNKKGTVKLLTSASTEARELDDELKADILRDGAVIVDNRGLTPTKILKIKNTGSWATPDTNGVYELLKLDGSTVTAYVVVGIRSKKRNGSIDGNNYVIPLDDGQLRVAHEVPAFILGQYMPLSRFDLSGGYSIGSLPVGTTKDYLIIDVDGSTKFVSALHPTYIGKADGEILIKAGEYARVKEPSDSSALWNSDSRRSESSPLNQIVVIPEGGTLRVKGSTLFVPASCRAIEMVDPDRPVTSENAVSAIPVTRLALATMDEYVDAVARREKLLGVKIYRDPSGFVISDDNGRTTDPLSKRAAAFDLVDTYVVEPDVASEMLRDIELRSGKRYLAKFAADTVYAMTVSEPQSSEPQINSVNLDQVSPESVRNTLIEAGNSGVKEVMDVTVLKLLAEDGSSVRAVQDMVPSLFNAMNSVGQLLFMLRASTSMTDAYGEYRADEMEQQFARLMQRLGDAVIVLQQGRVNEIKDLLEGPLSSTLG